ncbi:MAG: hypothetical protein LBH12_02585 [Dysgonamonadaceae bacterium]|nr:hypothetical protein [Dysgonamonadaceae bacterium]
MLTQQKNIIFILQNNLIHLFPVMKEKNKKIFIKILLLAAVFSLITSVVNLVLTVGIKTKFEKDMIAGVTKATNGLYALKIGDIEVSMLQKSILLKDISFDVAEERLNSLVKKDSLPRYYGSLQVKELHFNGLGINYRKSIRKRKLSLDKVKIVQPELTIIDTGNNRPGTKSVNSPYDMISPYLGELLISSIELTDGELHYKEENKKNTTSLSIFNLRCEAEKFKIDSVSRKKARALYSEIFTLSADSSRMYFPDKVYTLSTGKLTVSGADSLIQISDIDYSSTVPKWKSAYLHPNHADWMDVKVGEILLKGIDSEKYMNNKTVLADSVLISGVYFKSCKNKNIQVTPKKTPLIYESVQKFPVPFFISYLKASDFNVEYEELDKNGSVPGFINFTRMEGIFPEGITNIVKSPEQMNKLTVNGKLMNEGMINAELYLPVDSAYDYVHIKGSLGTMNMIPLNRIIEPLAPVRIEDGFIQGMNFDITGGREKAEIKMCLRYNDLSINILNSQKEKQRSDNIFLSFIANTAIPHNNPSEGKAIRCVEAEQERDPYRSSFNYLWKIYFAGVKETIGFSKAKQQRLEWIKKIL